MQENHGYKHVLIRKVVPFLNSDSCSDENALLIQYANLTCGADTVDFQHVASEV